MRKNNAKLVYWLWFCLHNMPLHRPKTVFRKRRPSKKWWWSLSESRKRRKITGSVQSLKAKDLSTLQNGNILQGIGGKVAGVQVISSGQPGSQPTIRMRGIGSINASSDPLIVLDGIPYSGNLNSIAASDIESISFLEDASSNALYGSRGANGVIIVNTKRGKNKGLSIEADVRTGVNFRSIQDYSVFTSPQDYYTAFYNRGESGKSQD